MNYNRIYLISFIIAYIVIVVLMIGYVMLDYKLQYANSIIDDKQTVIDLHRVVIDTKVNTIYEYDKKGYIHIDDKTIKLLNEIDNL